MPTFHVEPDSLRALAGPFETASQDVQGILGAVKGLADTLNSESILGSQDAVNEYLDGSRQWQAALTNLTESLGCIHQKLLFAAANYEQAQGANTVQSGP